VIVIGVPWIHPLVGKGPSKGCAFDLRRFSHEIVGSVLFDSCDFGCTFLFAKLDDSGVFAQNIVA
jgi:hypothetical protein